MMSNINQNNNNSNNNNNNNNNNSNSNNNNNNGTIKYIEEYEDALGVCFKLIDPHSMSSSTDLSVVKVAVQSLVDLSLSSHNSSYASSPQNLRVILYGKLLDIIQSPLLYRKAVIRCAITSIGTLVCYDETLVNQTITFLAKILEFKSENQQYLKRVCLQSLGRIGRRYIMYQDLLVGLLEKYFNPNISSKDVLCSILLAFGKLSQTNSQIRVMCMKRWLEAIDNPHYLFKIAGIQAIGYASCPTANIINDKNIESICYSKSIELLQYHKIDDYKGDEENDPWKRDEVYLVHHAAAKALGLLVRSNLGEWLPKLSKIFKAILQSPRYHGIVKSSVLYTYGQITYYLNSLNSPFFSPLKILLFELSTDDNPTIASPSCYALSKFGLSHESNYNEVKVILQSKIGNVKEAKSDILFQYLRPWSKILSKNYRPNLNQCSAIISPFNQDLYDQSMDVTNMLPLLKNKPINVNRFNSGKKLGDNMMILDQAISNYPHLVQLCHMFSPTVCQAILALIKKPSLLEQPPFKKAIRDKIFIQRSKGYQLTGEENWDSVLKDLSSHVNIRLMFVSLLRNPELLFEQKNQQSNKPQQQQQQQQPVIDIQSSIQNATTSKQFKIHPSLQKKKKVEPPKLTEDSTKKSGEEPLKPIEDSPSTTTTSTSTTTPSPPPAASTSLFGAPLPLIGEKQKQTGIIPEPQSTTTTNEDIDFDFEPPKPYRSYWPNSDELFKVDDQQPKWTPPTKTIESIVPNLTILPNINTSSTVSILFGKALPLIRKTTPNVRSHGFGTKLMDSSYSSVTTTTASKLANNQNTQQQVSAPSNSSSIFGNPLPLINKQNPSPPASSQSTVFTPLKPISTSTSSSTPSTNIFGTSLTPISSQPTPSTSSSTSSSLSSVFTPLPMIKKEAPIALPPQLKSMVTQKDNNQPMQQQKAEEEGEIVSSSPSVLTTSSSSVTNEIDTKDSLEIDLDTSQDDITSTVNNNNDQPYESLLVKRSHSLLDDIGEEVMENIKKKPKPDTPNDQGDANKQNVGGGSIVISVKPKKQSKKEKMNAKNQKKKDKKEKKEKKAKKPKDGSNLYVGINFDQPKKEEKPLCQFYKNGNCNKGNECPFKHEGPVAEKKVEICKFFKSGGCFKGAECTFAHDLKSEPCKFFNQGGCSKVDCQYGHFYSQDIQAPPQQQNNSPPMSQQNIFGQQQQNQQQNPNISPIQHQHQPNNSPPNASVYAQQQHNIPTQQQNYQNNNPVNYNMQPQQSNSPPIQQPIFAQQNQQQNISPPQQQQYFSQQQQNQQQPPQFQNTNFQQQQLRQQHNNSPPLPQNVSIFGQQQQLQQQPQQQNFSNQGGFNQQQQTPQQMQNVSPQTLSLLNQMLNNPSQLSMQQQIQLQLQLQQIQQQLQQQPQQQQIQQQQQPQQQNPPKVVYKRI